MSRVGTGLCVLVALAAGALAGTLLEAEDHAARTETRTVVRPTADPSVRAERLAPVPRRVSEGRIVLQHLVPRDAAVQQSWRLPPAAGVPEQVVVTWARPPGDVQPKEYGLTLWQFQNGAGRRLYRFNAPPFRRNGDVEVHGIGVMTNDVSGDGHLDVLSWQDLGGTSGNGVYRLVITGKGSARQVFRRANVTDSETIGLRSGSLIIDRGVKGSEDRTTAIHPDYKRWQRTFYRWDGRRLVPTQRSVIGLREHIDPLG